MLIELALALAPTLHGEEVVLGPPAVCQPFDIGKAPCLPWKAGAFGFDPEFPLDKLNPELASLLDRQADSLVQLESIRRAVIYAVGFGGTLRKGATAQEGEAGKKKDGSFHWNVSRLRPRVRGERFRS